MDWEAPIGKYFAQEIVTDDALLDAWLEARDAHNADRVDLAHRF